MQLVIAEKPSVAQSIASVLGARTKHNGYQEGNGYVVSWCFGHLAGLAYADVYDHVAVIPNHSSVHFVLTYWDGIHGKHTLL